MATFYLKCNKCKRKQGKSMTKQEAEKYLTTKQHKAKETPKCNKCGERLALTSDNYLSGIF